VHAGGRYVTATLAEKLAAGLRSDETTVPHETLSDREFQVFRALGRGESIKEIAHKLSLSPKTVSTYRTRILSKMEFKSNADLVRYAVEHGLVDL
jgi:DNA-binding NarL/FixJ family response regulator